MASGVYNRFKYNLLQGSGDILDDTIRVALLDTNHAFDADHDVLADVSANEVSGTGYAAGGVILSGDTVTQDDTNDRAYWDANDSLWGTASFTAYHAVVYDDTLLNDQLICSIDFGGAQTVTNGTFTIQWNSGGIIRLT